MKKHLLKLLLLCCVGILAISLVACVPSTEQYKLDFVVDGEVYFSRETNGYSRINPPTDPDKEGFIFEGWYFDEGTWSEKYFAHSLEQNPIHQDTKVYAKFKIDESHTCKAGGWEVVLESTCKQEGSQIKRCTICKKTMDSEVIPISTEHGKPYVVKEQVVNATCVATGSYLDVSYCSVCNRKLSEKKMTISVDKNAHDYSSGRLNFVEGKANFAAECALCDTKTFVADANVERKVVKAATCTEGGTIKYVYLAYGMSFETDLIDTPALGHKLCGVTIDDNKTYDEVNYREIVEKATPFVNDKNCTEKIDAIFTCETCSVPYCKITIAKPHSGTWVQTEAPTCHSAGKEVLNKCSACGEKSLVRNIAPTGNHIEDAYTLRINNDKTVDLVIPCVNAPDGCDHVVTVLRDVDVTTEKIISYDCAIDDVIRYTYKDETRTVKLDVTICSGHFVNGVRSSTLKDAEGWFDYRYVNHGDDEGGIKLFTDDKLICNQKVNGYYDCEFCGRRDNVQVYRPHEGDWETTKAPTCTTEGVANFYCDFCDYGDDGKVTKVLPVTPHEYDWQLKIIENDDSIFAPFALIGKCSCGAGGRIDNILVTTRITRVATCSVPGELTYVYEHEGKEYTTTRALPKIAHKLDGESVETGARLDYATYGTKLNIKNAEAFACGIEGTAAYYKCSDCGCNVDVVVYREHKGEWKITLDAEKSTVCESVGTKSFACTYFGCGYTETLPYSSSNHAYEATLTTNGGVSKLELACTVEGCTSKIVYDGITDVKVIVKVAATCCADGVVEYSFVHQGTSHKFVANVGKGNHVYGGVDYTTLLVDGKMPASVEGLIIIDPDNAIFKCEACEHVVQVTLKKD